VYPGGTKCFGVRNDEMGYCTPEWGTFGSPGSRPQLRICKLHFVRCITSIFDPPPPDDLLPIDSSFVTISSMLDRLQSLSLRSCTFAFLSHLIRRVPQLRVLSFALCRSWLSNKHSSMHGNIM
jgi:hypothetical protein